MISWKIKHVSHCNVITATIRLKEERAFLYSPRRSSIEIIKASRLSDVIFPCKSIAIPIYSGKDSSHIKTRDENKCSDLYRNIN